MPMDRPKPPVAYHDSASCSPRRRVLRGSDAIKPIPPNGFALAASLQFVLSGHVAFPKQNRRVLAGMTDILAQRGEELAFVKLGNLNNDDSLSMNL